MSRTGRYVHPTTTAINPHPYRLQFHPSTIVRQQISKRGLVLGTMLLKLLEKKKKPFDPRVQRQVTSQQRKLRGIVMSSYLAFFNVVHPVCHGYEFHIFYYSTS